MRISRALLTITALGAASAGAALAAERRLLKEMDAAPSPAGWKIPRFPAGTETMVPTDDGAELVVASAGPHDAPTVVLVHGLTGNHNDWGLVAEPLLEQGFRVVGINQRGHGGSTVGTAGFGAERQGADVGQVLCALDLHDVVLCGHSMGGVAANGLMLLRPDEGADRVAAMVLVSTLLSGGGFERWVSIKFGNTEFYERLASNPHHAAAFARYLFGRTPSRAMVDAALAVNELCPRETRDGAALGLLDFDYTEKFSSISIPTLSICGDMDKATPLAENREIADLIKCDMIVVEGSGHLVIWEHPEVIVDGIVSLARRLTNATHS